MFSKKFMVWVCIVLAIAVSVAFVLAHALAYQRSRFASARVRPAVRAVVEAQVWSKVTGAYWENEIENQFRNVSGSPRDRIEFLKGILLCCELDSLRAITF